MQLYQLHPYNQLENQDVLFCLQNFSVEVKLSDLIPRNIALSLNDQQETVDYQLGTIDLLSAL